MSGPISNGMSEYVKRRFSDYNSKSLLTVKITERQRDICNNVECVTSKG